jgi:hypothetical protein
MSGFPLWLSMAFSLRTIFQPSDWCHCRVLEGTSW